MIYWNNFYWKIKSKSLDVFSKNKKDTSLISNSDISLEYVPVIYSKDGFCISGKFKGTFSLQLGNYKFDFKSNEFKDFTVDYSDGKMIVNEEKIFPKFNSIVKMNIIVSKHTSLKEWTLCPKKEGKFPTCFVNF